MKRFHLLPPPWSIELLTKTAVKYDPPIYPLDVEQAFIGIDLDCNNYIGLPPGFREKSGQVVHINMSLYGSKQFGRMLNALLVSTVVGSGLEHCKTDLCVFRLMNDEIVMLMVAVHADDLFVVRGG